MEQPTAEVSEDDVERILRRDHPEADLPELRALIRTVEVREKWCVVAACLKNAAGSTTRLRTELKDASGYWREILSEAENPLASKRRNAMDELSDADRRAVHDRDRRQYDEWFRRS
jgi:hypothetical protein